MYNEREFLIEQLLARKEEAEAGWPGRKAGLGPGAGG